MPYLLMVVEERGQRSKRGQVEARRLYDEMVAFSADLKEQGILLRAESLRTDDHATRVTARYNVPQLLDGPFAEAKEMIGGFFLIEVSTREQAVEIARACPATRWATVEVRECAPCYIP